MVSSRQERKCQQSWHGRANNCALVLKGVSDMKVEFFQTHHDYYNAYQYISCRVGKSTKWRYLATGTGALFGFLLVIGVMSIFDHYEKYSYFENTELTFGLVLIFVAFIILFVGLKIYNSKVKSLIFEKGGLFLSRFSFEIQRDCLIHFMADNRHEYQWKNVKEVEQTEDYIFVFLDRGAALYIPKHGFSSEKDFEIFHTTLNEHL